MKTTVFLLCFVSALTAFGADPAAQAQFNASVLKGIPLTEAERQKEFLEAKRDAPVIALGKSDFVFSGPLVAGFRRLPPASDLTPCAAVFTAAGDSVVGAGTDAESAGWNGEIFRVAQRTMRDGVAAGGGSAADFEGAVGREGRRRNEECRRGGGGEHRTLNAERRTSSEGVSQGSPGWEHPTSNTEHPMGGRQALAKVSASATALSMALALFTVSWNSASGVESFTQPPPACT